MSGAAKEPEGLFLYGTLMRGEMLSPAIKNAHPTCWLLARCFGHDLFNLGPYPCMYPTRPSVTGEVMSVVQGEFVTVSDLASLLVELDEIEEFYPSSPETSAYLRLPVEIDLFGGQVHSAWAYMAPHLPSVPRIESNDWRIHRKVRESAILEIVRAHGVANAADRLLAGTLSELDLSRLSGKSAVLF